MTKTKRRTALILALVLAFSLALGLAACSGDAASGSQSASKPAASAPPASQPKADSSQPAPVPGSEPVQTKLSQPAGPVMPAEGIDPLTGLEAAEGMLYGQRPVAVMVRGSARAMPQRGLGAFSVAVEIPIEDGTTNLMLLYSDLRAVPNAGPVTELQDQFLQMALPVQAIPAHIGASQYARNLLTLLDYKSLDGQYVGTTTYWYDVERTLPKPGGKLHEYSWFTNSDTLWAGMTAIDVVTVGEVPLLFNFGEGGPAVSEDAVTVNAVYGGGTTVTLKYSAKNGTYSDAVNGEGRVGDDEGRARYKNVFLLETAIGTKADSQLLEFDLSGGTGWYFVDGNAIPVNWVKGGPTQQLYIYDEANQPLTVAPGTSYIGFVPKAEVPGITWAGPDAEG